MKAFKPGDKVFSYIDQGFKFGTNIVDLPSKYEIVTVTAYQDGYIGLKEYSKANDVLPFHAGGFKKVLKQHAIKTIKFVDKDTI